MGVSKASRTEAPESKRLSPAPPFARQPATPNGLPSIGPAPPRGSERCIYRNPRNPAWIRTTWLAASSEREVLFTRGVNPQYRTLFVPARRSVATRQLEANLSVADTKA